MSARHCDALISMRQQLLRELMNIAAARIGELAYKLILSFIVMKGVAQ